MSTPLTGTRRTRITTKADLEATIRDLRGQLDLKSGLVANFQKKAMDVIEENRQLGLKLRAAEENLKVAERREKELRTEINRLLAGNRATEVAYTNALKIVSNGRGERESRPPQFTDVEGLERAMAELAGVIGNR